MPWEAFIYQNIASEVTLIHRRDTFACRKNTTRPVI